MTAGAALAAPNYVPFSSTKQPWGVERGALITGGIYRYGRNVQASRWPAPPSSRARAWPLAVIAA